MMVPWVARSLARMIWQPAPFQVPSAKPIICVVSGARLVNCARTSPEPETLKSWLTPPFMLSEPGGVIGNVSVTEIGVGVVMGVSSLQAAALKARATDRIANRRIGSFG